MTSVSITAEDRFNNVVTGFSNSVALSDNAGGASFAAVSFTGGKATVTATLDKAGTQTITANDSAATISGTSNSITVTPAAASKLLVSATPSNLSAGSTTSLTITAEDQFNNVVTGFSDSVTLSDSLGGASFAAVSFSGGKATVAATLDKAGPQTITANDSAATISATSNSVTVTPAAASKLLVSAIPSNLTAGSTTSITVTAEDQFNNVVTSFSDSVTLSDSLGGATFSSLSFTGGKATVTATLDKAGTQTITATDPAATISGTSGAISVTPGAATQLLITTQPPPTVTAGSTFALTVTAEDAEDNVATGFNGDELVTLLANPGDSLLGGPIDVTANNGVAVFSSLTLSSGGSGYTFQVSSAGLIPATSNSITVNQPPYITSSSSATFIAGSTGALTVTDSGYPTPITLSEIGTLPSGVTFNNTTGVLSAAATTAVGSYPIEFTASNGIGSNATQAFVLNIVPSSVTVADGGFETPSVGSGVNAYQYDPTGSPWTFTGHAGISANASGFTSGNPSTPEGVQVAFLQNTGSASQSISFQPGTYQVTFEAAQRANISSNQSVEVLVDGNAVGTITPSGTNYASYSQSFTITTAGMHTLTFEGLPPSSDPRGGEYDTAFIDAVTVSVSQPNQPIDPGFESPSLGAARERTSMTRRARLGRSAAMRE